MLCSREYSKAFKVVLSYVMKYDLDHVNYMIKACNNIIGLFPHFYNYSFFFNHGACSSVPSYCNLFS